jgi:hypothetical protein
MTTWSTLTWTLARAGGLTAYGLLSLSVILGLTLSLRLSTTTWPRLLTNDLHRFLTLLSLVFVAVHGLASWLDSFMRFSWSEMLIPLTSHYRPLWMALGILGGYLALAVWISTELRSRIGHTLWRRLHGLAFGAYLLATVHGLATGSDTHTAWALALYGSSVAAVGALLIYRLLTPIGAARRTRPVLAQLVGAVLVCGAVWTVLGPAQAGWNATANNGQGTGGRGAPAVAAAASPPASAPFTANLQGSLTQRADGASGGVLVAATATLSGNGGGAFQMTLHGRPANDGSVAISGGTMAVTTPGGARFQGALQDLQSDGAGVRIRALLSGAGGSGSRLSIQALLQISSDGQLSGTMQGVPQ